MKPEPKYRVFKLSISIPFSRSCLDSKVYEIDNNIDFIYPALLYTIGTLLFGFWNIFGIPDSLKAIYTNLTGGEDYTEIINSDNYDDFTNRIWNNLDRETSTRIDRECIELLLDVQEDFLNQNTDHFSDYNVRYLKDGLSRKGYREIKDSDILDFFEAIQIVLNRESDQFNQRRLS